MSQTPEKVFRLNVTMCATVYVKATDHLVAETKAKGFMHRKCFTFSGDTISRSTFDDPNLPEVSLSPIMTGGNRWPVGEVDEVYP